jgi:hypothetical protein
MIRIEYQKNHRLGYFSTSDYYKPIGSVSGYKCYVADGEDDQVWIDFVDPDFTDSQGNAKRVCEMILNETKNRVYEVEIVLLDKEYRGLNLTPRFYAFLLRKMSITLKAGSAQSAGGRSIWTRLAARRDVMVYGRTPYGRPVMMIVNEKNELEPIHGRYEAYDDRDFEMFAVRAA